MWFFYSTVSTGECVRCLHQSLKPPFHVLILGTTGCYTDTNVRMGVQVLMSFMMNFFSAVFGFDLEAARVL